jgi:hypothetical protein
MLLRPSIRRLYRNGNSYVNRPASTGSTALPDQPVPMPPPGSKRREAILRRRAMAGTALFHPLDQYSLE